ncbi:Uncharacterised protein [Mycobacteroides abscessus subsp. abscessus]|nr:Uncharacterised protein [Mycobacteroides abscessus subsp. abscessus]
MLECAPRLGLVVERCRGCQPLRVRIDRVVDEPAEWGRARQCLRDCVVVGVIGCVGEQFDGEVELVAVDAARSVEDVLCEAGQHVDVVVDDVELERPIGCLGADVGERGDVGEIVVVVLGEEFRQRARRGEHEDSSPCTEEHGVVSEVAAQREVFAGPGDDLDRVDADARPEIVVVDVIEVVFVVVRGIVGARRGRDNRSSLGVFGVVVEQVDVVVGLVLVLGRRRGFEFIGGDRDGRGVDVGGLDDVIDGVEDVVPVLGDETSDADPQVDAVAALEVAGTGRHRSEDRVAVEELGDGDQFADLAEDAHDLECVLEFGDHLGCRVFCRELRHTDEIIGVAVVGDQFVGRELLDGVPRRVLDEIVVRVGADEADEFGDAGEYVQVIVESEECLPLVVALTPAWRPQGETVSVGESEFDGNDVSGHEATA